MPDRLGDLQCLARHRLALVEAPEIRQSPAEESPCENRRADRDAEALVAALAGQELDDAPGAREASLIVAEEIVRDAEIGVRQNRDRRVTDLGGDLPGLLTVHHGLIGPAGVGGGPGHQGVHKTLAPAIAKALGERLELVEHLEDPRELAERDQGAPEIEADVEGLIERALVDVMLERLERLVEVGHRLAV